MNVLIPVSAHAPSNVQSRHIIIPKRYQRGVPFKQWPVRVDAYLRNRKCANLSILVGHPLQLSFF